MRTGRTRIASCRWVASFAFVLLMPSPMPAESPSQDPFGAFYLQQRKMYYDLGEEAAQAKFGIVGQVVEEATRSGNSPYLHGALVWAGQVYSKMGHANLAIPLLEQVVKDPSASPHVKDVARFELGLSLSRDGCPEEAAKVYRELLNDPRAARALRGMSAEQLRMVATQQEDWTMLTEVSKVALQEELGRTPVLLESAGRGLRRLGRYDQAALYYERIGEEFPDCRPTNRMIFIDKAAATCRHGNQRERVGYILEMRGIIARYANTAAEQNAMFAEVYQECYSLAMNCTAAPAAYKLWREQIPIGEDEIAELGLAMFREAIDGCKELPKDLTKNIEFEAVVFGSHMGASQLLVQMGRPHEARRLLEDFLRLYSHFPAGRLQQAQRYLEAIFFGSLDLSATPLDDALNQVDSVSEWSDRTVSEQDRPPPSRSKIHPTAPEKGRVSSTEKGGDRGLRRAWVTVIAGAGVAIGVIFGLVKRSRFRRSKKTEHCH